MVRDCKTEYEIGKLLYICMQGRLRDGSHGESTMSCDRAKKKQCTIRLPKKYNH